MKYVTMFHKETGRICGQLVVSNDRDLTANVPENHATLDGHHDASKYRVDIETGALVEHNELPVAHPMIAQMQAARAHQGLSINAVEALVAFALGREGARKRLEEIDAEFTKLRIESPYLEI